MTSTGLDYSNALFTVLLISSSVACVIARGQYCVTDLIMSYFLFCFLILFYICHQKLLFLIAGVLSSSYSTVKV